MSARIAALGALAMLTGACTAVPASPETVARFAPTLPREGEVRTYGSLAEVPGRIRVIGEVEVGNAGEERAGIEARLRQTAAEAGANAIVLHPFNRWALGAGYNDGGWDGFDLRRVSRATAIRVEGPIQPQFSGGV